MNLSVLHPRILMLRLKGAFNRRFPYYRRCLGRVWCLRVQVYDLSCFKHQEVYDRRAARRLRTARREVARRRARAYRNPAGRY